MTWSKAKGIGNPIDADTFLARAVQQEDFDALQAAERDARRYLPCDCGFDAHGAIEVCRYCREREAGT